MTARCPLCLAVRPRWVSLACSGRLLAMWLLWHEVMPTWARHVTVKWQHFVSSSSELGVANCLYSFVCVYPSGGVACCMLSAQPAQIRHNALPVNSVPKRSKLQYTLNSRQSHYTLPFLIVPTCLSSRLECDSWSTRTLLSLLIIWHWSGNSRCSHQTKASGLLIVRRATQTIWQEFCGLHVWLFLVGCAEFGLKLEQLH